MHANWQFFLAEADTLIKIADITKLCRGKQLQLALNRPGTFNWNMPLDTDWVAYLNPAEYAIICTKNKTDVWSGPIWTKSEDFAGQKITLSAVGWFQLLMKRYITDQDHTYQPDVNQGQLAFNLLALANSHEVEGVPRPTGITAGTNTSEQIYTSKKFSRWQNIGEEIINLTQVESGFDFVIDPVTKVMNIKNWDEFVDNTSTIFGFNFGPNNVINVTRETNADDLKNQYYIAGQYGVAEAHDVSTTSINQYGLHQGVEQINEIPDTQLLGAIANAELAINEYPRITINFDPKGEGTQENIPRLFEDYNVGDKIYLTAKQHGAEIINQAIRVFGVTLDIDENGNEKVTSLQTTSQAAQ